MRLLSAADRRGHVEQKGGGGGGGLTERLFPPSDPLPVCLYNTALSTPLSIPFLSYPFRLVNSS